MHDQRPGRDATRASGASWRRREHEYTVTATITDTAQVSYLYGAQLGNGAPSSC